MVTKAPAKQKATPTKKKALKTKAKPLALEKLHKQVVECHTPAKVSFTHPDNNVYEKSYRDSTYGFVPSLVLLLLVVLSIFVGLVYFGLVH